MKEVALRLQVTTRTLRSWKVKFKKDCQMRSGRPRYTAQDHRKAMIMVCRELHRQGYPGSTAIAKKLNGEVQLRLIRLYVKLFKERKRHHKDLLIKEQRTTVKVHKKNAIWTEDGTHLGRIENKAVEAQIIKDRASLKTLCAFTGSAANGVHVVSALKKIKKQRGLPLVWMTDNGPAYCNKIVSSFLQREKVVHLRSLPRTPQHNGAIEVFMKEVKEASMLGKKVPLESAEAAHKELVKIIQRLNDNRLRASLEFKSASEIDDKIDTFLSNVSRDVFYNEYCMYLSELQKRQQSWRAERMQEREMVMCLLEKYELIKRTRGGRDHVV